MDSSEVFTQDLVNDVNTLEEVTYTTIPVIDGSLPSPNITVPRHEVDIIQSTSVRSTNSPQLTLPLPSPPYVESTSPSLQQTGHSTQTNEHHSLIHGLQPLPPPPPRGVAAQGGQKLK